jgi:hypothetical protein
MTENDDSTGHTAADQTEQLAATLLREVPNEPMLQFFHFSHLPVRLRGASMLYAQLALQVCQSIPHNPERTMGLRKLLESKDCAVRAVLFTWPADTVRAASPPLIPPTVGRVVWYTPHHQEGFGVRLGVQPYTAQVAYVHNDRLINLIVADHEGVSFAELRVPLLQEGDLKPAEGRFASWMPYQLGQAAKATAVSP